MYNMDPLYEDVENESDIPSENSFTVIKTTFVHTAGNIPERNCDVGKTVNKSIKTREITDEALQMASLCKDVLIPCNIHGKHRRLDNISNAQKSEIKSEIKTENSTYIEHTGRDELHPTSECDMIYPSLSPSARDDGYSNSSLQKCTAFKRESPNTDDKRVLYPHYRQDMHNLMLSSTGININSAEIKESFVPDSSSNISTGVHINRDCGHREELSTNCSSGSQNKVTGPHVHISLSNEVDERVNIPISVSSNDTHGYWKERDKPLRYANDNKSSNKEGGTKMVNTQSNIASASATYYKDPECQTFERMGKGSRHTYTQFYCGKSESDTVAPLLELCNGEEVDVNRTASIHSLTNGTSTEQRESGDFQLATNQLIDRTDRPETSTHKGQNSYTCKINQKTLRTSRDESKHTVIQRRQQSYTCNVCFKTFSQACHLKTHLFTHTGEKPYTCTICNKTFAQAGHLRTHLFTHTGEKPNTCNICSKTFSQGSSLRIHQFTHTGEKPHSCKLCGKTFSLSGHLRTHQLTHTGEKLHSCKICSKSFSQAGNLKTHQLTHSGEKPHSCVILRPKLISKGQTKSTPEFWVI